MSVTMKKIEEIYEVSSNEGSEIATLASPAEVARIHFKANRYGHMVFDKCQFGFSGQYAYNQWMFLRQIANAIEELTRRYESVGPLPK